MIAIISITVIVVVCSTFTFIVGVIAVQRYRAKKKKKYGMCCVSYLMYKYMFVYSNFMCTTCTYCHWYDC